MPLTTAQREKLVHETKSWIGTPYRGWSRVKGPKGGVDCGQILAGVYINAGFLAPEIDLPKYYSLSVAQHKESTEYIDLIRKYFREVPEAEALPGDIVVYKLGLAFAHAALIVEWPAFVVHAFAHGGVRGASGDKHPRLMKTSRKFFTLKEEFIPANETLIEKVVA
jgi:cell wall-associated NlpC family hydrolase